MNARAPAPSHIVIPDSAPFSPDQRAWLSGFFTASLAAMSKDALAEAVNKPGDLGDLTDSGTAGPPLADNDDAPWHDPALGADERMDLAKDRALAPRLMAAMAQQDCGQCGYTCATYANKIFTRDEPRLNLCAPGGKSTARLLKTLAVELDGGVEAPEENGGPESAIAGPLGYCREAPVEGVFLSRRKLNQAGSEKDTWHIEFDIAQAGVAYDVGDALGVFAKNNLGLVDQIIANLGCSHIVEVMGKPLRQALLEDFSLAPATDSLFELLSYVLGGAARQKARALARGEDPDGDAANLDVLAALQKFPQARPHPEAFVQALEPLQPRLYSISSSPKCLDGGVSLTVDAVRYVVNKRRRLGVASSFLAEGIKPGDRLKVYVQKSEGFRLPEDPSKPVIMIGPGTGVAPFRAFLQERRATGAPGKNWLFFGHRSQLTDFFYKSEFEELRQAGVLTRLSLAWSRDGDRKFYVQDRMREVGFDLWRWLQEGARVYVCGDAKRMAKDVETALVDIAAEQGRMTPADAALYVSRLKKDHRILFDVY